MCLTSAGKLKTAKRNIYCYKRLYDGNKSEHTNYTYEIGVEQKEVMMFLNYPQEVHIGYHSWRFFTPFRMHLFVIPKGSKYYKGRENEGSLGYTSSKIVFLGHILSLKTWWRVIKFKSK